jgi:hypothetical protein
LQQRFKRHETEPGSALAVAPRGKTTRQGNARRGAEKDRFLQLPKLRMLVNRHGAGDGLRSVAIKKTPKVRAAGPSAGRLAFMNLFSVRSTSTHGGKFDDGTQGFEQTRAEMLCTAFTGDSGGVMSAAGMPSRDESHLRVAALGERRNRTTELELAAFR